MHVLERKIKNDHKENIRMSGPLSLYGSVKMIDESAKEQIATSSFC